MRILIVAVLAGATVAQAGDANDAPAPMARVRAIEAAEAQLRVAQQATGDAALAAYEACGQAYLGVFDDAPKVVGADELLYDAAVCFAHAGSAAAAVQLGEQLVRDFPKSRLAPHALRQVAALDLALGWFEPARAAWTRLATLYPADAEAPAALWNAAAIAATLGDDGAAALVEQFERTYGGKRPDDAGRLRAHLAEGLAARGDVAGAIAAYATALGRWRGSPAERAALVVARAELLWQRACPLADARGLCVRGAGPLVAVARRATDVADATAAFAQVARSFDPHDPQLARAMARVRLHQAEAAVEAVVALGGVPPLAVDQAGKPTPAGLKRMSEWLRSWQQAMATADRAATDAFALPHGPSAVAVAERLARMYQHAAATLIAAPVPRMLVGTPAATAYRDQLAEVAEPLRQKAQAAAEACLSKATALGVVDDAVASCGAIVGQAAPAVWALAERVPGATAAPIDAVPEAVPAPPPPAPPP